MRRSTCAAAAVLALVALPTPTQARDLEDSLASRWRGAWVLTAIDTYSDCGGIHTNNLVHGSLVESRGHFRFKPGELAQVKDLDLKHAKLELSLTLPESLLVSYQDGPFTLYNEVRCLMDFDVELPRALVKDDDLKGIEDALQPVLKRFESQEQATASRFWNRRQREPYPEDYDRTLAQHAAWKAQQGNAVIQARIDQATEETARIANRVSSDPDYLKGLSAGIEAVKAMDLSRCGDLLGRDFNNIAPKVPQFASFINDTATRFQHGYQDGARLLFGLESLQRLPQCMVPVPEIPQGPEPSDLPRR